ncbi:MAG: phenylalanine--tRNA ligase subunit alpha [Clostridiales bacterium]|nr:phenylalanine--tRNA ligase subunit alpha [Clostridiales bacterium]
MEQKIIELVKNTKAKVNDIGSAKELNDLKVEVLGKSGELTLILRGLKDLSADERPVMGKIVNDARVELEAVIGEKFAQLEQKELNEKLLKEKIDISIDKKTPLGKLHPLNIIKRRAIDFFISMGFIVTESPEIETTYYNFDMLNIPPDHPARETQDTFFITDKILLTTQTSAGQIRTMEKIKPPIKMISPGRVFRSDEADATHTPCFHQMEGLVVDKGITMCDLKGILSSFAKHFFDANTTIRFRPSHFPFTEPSVEVDVSCVHCGGKGCNVCKGTGWIEILGAGMVNRRVLAGCGIDPDVYTGFAFGVGLDRITAIIHGINDARVPFEGDIRFLKQF